MYLWVMGVHQQFSWSELIGSNLTYGTRVYVLGLSSSLPSMFPPPSFSGTSSGPQTVVSTEPPRADQDNPALKAVDLLIFLGIL